MTDQGKVDNINTNSQSRRLWCNVLNLDIDQGESVSFTIYRYQWELLQRKALSPAFPLQGAEDFDVQRAYKVFTGVVAAIENVFMFACRSLLKTKKPNRSAVSV